MEIIINGKARQVEDNSNITDVLQLLDLAGKRVAVEINLEIIPRSEHDTYQLESGDRIEIVHAIGGGLYAGSRPMA